MIFSAFHQRLTLRTRLIASAVLLAASGLLLASHASAVREMKQTGLPSAMRIPAIEQRMGMLRQQAEVAQLRASLSGGTQQELLRAYVLPSSEELDRLLGTFDVIVSYLESTGKLFHVSPVSVGDAAEVTLPGSDTKVTSLPVTFSAVTTREGFDALHAFIGTAGLFTVGDLLDTSEISRLLQLSEQENPAAINALEEFLSMDLLRYAERPSEAQNKLLLSFSSEAFEQMLRSYMGEARTRGVVDLLSALQGTLRERQLWPVRMLTVDTIDMRMVDGGHVEAAFALKAYVRGR